MKFKAIKLQYDDVKELIEYIKKEMNAVDLVYMDPPYSTANYSRFYHIPETLVRYDYPSCDSKGCYRNDRHKSNFSNPRLVNAEFESGILPKANLDPLVKEELTIRNTTFAISPRFAFVALP